MNGDAFMDMVPLIIMFLFCFTVVMFVIFMANYERKKNEDRETAKEQERNTELDDYILPSCYRVEQFKSEYKMVKYFVLYYNNEILSIHIFRSLGELNFEREETITSLAECSTFRLGDNPFDYKKGGSGFYYKDLNTAKQVAKKHQMWLEW